jgi:DNA-binding LacI/PurR family transcriptional regulator
MPLLEVPFMDQTPDDQAASAPKKSGLHLACVAQLLRQTDRPTAVIGSNDLIAIRCLRTAQQIGLRVPQDISIIGFDGIGLGAELFPRPTTIVQPNEEIGRQCIGLLLGAIARQQPVPAQESILLPYIFDPGESCAPSPFQLQAP